MKQRAYPTGRKNPFPIVILKRKWTPLKKTPVVNRRVNLIQKRPGSKDHRILKSAKKDIKLNTERGKEDGVINPISSRKRKFIRRFIRKLKKTREQYRTNKTKSSLYNKDWKLNICNICILYFMEVNKSLCQTSVTCPFVGVCWLGVFLRTLACYPCPEVNFYWTNGPLPVQTLSILKNNEWTVFTNLQTYSTVTGILLDYLRRSFKK